MSHLLTVDVEAWFRGLGADPTASPPDPELAPSLDRLLDVLAEMGATATFFVLGADAARLKAPLCRGLAEGHEIACHGMWHRPVAGMTPAGFRQDIRDALAAIEHAVSIRCRGYRAPWFSAPAGTDWYAETLADEGIVYDASFRLPLAARAAGARRGRMTIMPTPLMQFGPVRVGVLGGLALRLLPEALIRHMIRRCEQYAQPACLYLHPYEWYTADPGKRGRRGRRLSTWRREWRRDRTLPRLRRLGQKVRLVSMDNWLKEAPRA